MDLIIKTENEFKSAYEFLNTFKIRNENKELVPVLSICEQIWKEEINQYKTGFSEEDYCIEDFILDVVEGDPVEYLIPICKHIVNTQEELIGCLYEVGYLYDGGVYVKFFSIKFESIEELDKFYELKKKEMK